MKDIIGQKCSSYFGCMECEVQHICITINQQRDKLKPPYNCPKCYQPRSVTVEKLETKYEKKTFINTYRVRCAHECFDERITLPAVYTELDAFNRISDQITRA